MKKGNIIVIDAWEILYQEDKNKFSFLKDEIKNFSKYLNICLSNLRNHYNIYHDPTRKEITKEIDISKDKIIVDIKEIDNNLTNYFCGYHLGRCIDRKIKNSLSKNVILNLSLLFPEDGLDKINKELNYFFYTYKNGLERIKIQ